MTVAALVFLFILTLGIVGPPAVYIMGEDSLFYGYMIHARDLDLCLHAYYSILYSVALLVVLHWLFLSKMSRHYAQKPFITGSNGQYIKPWACAMAAAGACAVVLFAQNGFSHPLLSSGQFLDVRAFAEQRAASAQAMNMSIYSAGLHVFVAYALLLALIVIKKPIFTISSIAFCLFFVTFSLAKSPAADLILQLTLTYLLIKQSSWRPLLYLALGMAALVLFSAYILQMDSMGPVLTGITARLFLGEIADLPDYFTVFESARAPVSAMLPPYIQALFGYITLPPAKVVMNHLVAGTPNADIAGFANTFFSGSAYAYAGVIGVLVAPIIVFLNFWVGAKILISFKKTPLSVFVGGFIIYKLTKALFSDIGCYVFSAVQIMMLAFIVFKFMQQTGKSLVQRKNGPSLG